LFARILGGPLGQVLAIFVVIAHGRGRALTAFADTDARGGDAEYCAHGAFPHFLSKENKHGAPTFALVVDGCDSQQLTVLKL